jgi:hypothetical protein
VFDDELVLHSQAMFQKRQFRMMKLVLFTFSTSLNIILLFSDHDRQILLLLPYYSPLHEKVKNNILMIIEFNLL